MPSPFFMGPGMQPTQLITDIGFTFIAVLFCLLIYFKTRELYDLTKYKGIKYFRLAFLYFGLSYLVRFLLRLLMISSIAFDFFLPMRNYMPYFITLLSYLSTISIFYIIYCHLWKEFNSKNAIMLAHVIAIFLSVLAFATRSHILLLLIQTILLAFAMTLSIWAEKSKVKFSQIQFLYLLMSVLWLFNLWVIDRKRPFGGFDADIFFEVISIGVFIAIYYKLSKWIK